MTEIDINASSSGGLESHKTWAILYSQSQSLVSSLLVNLLIVFSRLWHWLQHLWVSEEEDITQQVVKIQSSPIISEDKQEEEKVKEGFSEQLDNPDDQEIVKKVDIANSDKVPEQDNKMTIEVFAQQEQVGLQKYSLPMPITMRLNSQSLDQEDDHDSLLEYHQDASQVPSSQADQDSCSGYCSGSGSSLPGSPTPNSNIKEHHQTLSSSDEHENEHEIYEKDSTSTAALPLRRDSDTSDSSEVNGEEISPETISKIVSQVETMFSDDHLAKDGFLLKHVRRRSDGFVSLKLVAGLRKVKQISREFPVVMNALKTSSKLEVNTEGTKVRRVEPLTPVLKSMPIKQAKKDKSQTDKEKNQAEKENHNQHHNGGGMTDEQQIARKRRQKGDKLNELQYERGHQLHKNYNYNNNSGRSSISSMTDETPQVIRRRGGSLPIPSSSALSQKRGSTAGNYLYPNASPPNGSAGFLRPKSNSYSEGTDPSAATMSSWLQKRKSAASSRLSNGEISLNGALRQPRGPDGTKGFHPGHRRLIVEERLQREMMSQLSTFSA